LFCKRSHLLRRANEAANSQMAPSGTVGRDAMRKIVNAKLLVLLNTFWS